MQKIKIPSHCYDPFQQINIINDLSNIIFEYAIENKITIHNGAKTIICNQFEKSDKTFIKIDIKAIEVPFHWVWSNYLQYDICYSLFDLEFNFYKNEDSFNCIILSTKHYEILSPSYEHLFYNIDELKNRFSIIYDVDVNHRIYQLTKLNQQIINSIWIKIST